MTKRLTSKDYALLSAYMDGMLSPRERSKVEKQLEARVEFRTALYELQQTRKAMRSLPRKRVPRNFLITPAMVQPRRAPFAVGALRFSSAMAAIAAVILTLFQLLPSFQMAAAPAPELYAESTSVAALQSPAEAMDSAPPIIQWGAPYAGGMGGGGAEGLAEPAPLGMGQGGVGGGADALKEWVPTPTEPAGSIELQSELTPTPYPTPTPAPTPTPTPTLVTLPLDQAQPILGVAPEEEQGTVVNAEPAARDADLPPVNPPRPGLVLQTAAVILGALAVIFFVAALFLRRRFR